MAHEFNVIIACEAFKGELESLKDEIMVDIHWVEHSLHDFPIKLKAKIIEKIQGIESYLPTGSNLLLFFGNCGGALEGISSKAFNLYYPDVADCIPIILGSMERFSELHAMRPGTFYLNKAWIDSGQDPLGTSNKYISTYGEVKGRKVALRLYKHYTHFALLDNGCYELEAYRAHVQKACDLFEKKYVEEKGTLDFVRQVLNGQCRMKEVLADVKK